jgi:hypothetical protein
MWLCLLQFLFGFYGLVMLDDIADLECIESFKGHAAFQAFLCFADILFDLS